MAGRSFLTESGSWQSSAAVSRSRLPLLEGKSCQGLAPVGRGRRSDRRSPAKFEPQGSDVVGADVGSLVGSAGVDTLGPAVGVAVVLRLRSTRMAATAPPPRQRTRIVATIP